MDRRTFIVLTLAGCAEPSSNMLPAATPLPAPPQAPPPTASPAPPPPPPSEPMSFAGWLESYRPKALAKGVPAGVLDRELAGLTPNPQVAGLDTKQPEFSKPAGDYLKGVVSADRLAQGGRFRSALPYLGALEQRYGVPRDVVLAVWAMESAFGKIQGDLDVVRSLATLAHDGRRRDWAEGELTSALKIIASGEHPRSRLTGSWAGAMGQTQFLPGVFLSTAIDADGDGRRDIWGSTHDALASTANYLAKAGWVPGVGWAREVILPQGFDYSQAEGPREIPAYWEAQGARRADGLPWTAADSMAKAGLVLPSGWRGPAFLTFPNHYVIRKYNNSTSYALGIGMLADGFAGSTGTVTPWPYETGLSMGDRVSAQTSLARLGFDPGAPDGIVGAGTRAALRGWQKARGLPADGYLSADLVRRLASEAAAVP